MCFCHCFCFKETGRETSYIINSVDLCWLLLSAEFLESSNKVGSVWTIDVYCGEMAFFPLCTRFWSAVQQTAFKAVSFSLGTPICPTSFPRRCELESMRETWTIWSAGCLWRHFSFYFSPTPQLLSTRFPKRNSHSNRAVSDRVLFHVAFYFCVLVELRHM